MGTLALVLALMAGCQSKAPKPQTDPVVEPAPAPPPVAKPADAPPPPPPPPTPLRLAVLVSDDQTEYSAVARVLAERSAVDQVDVIEFHGKSAAARAGITRLRETGHENVVAVGLLAATAARDLKSARVVFCQVFNHQQQQLLGPQTLGIEAIPPLDGAIEAWRSLGATPKRVGVITGTGHEDVVARARRALQQLGIELQHEVTTSDKETIVALKRMLPDIDGYWLLPDNRVLSRQALRDLMAMTRRAGVDVLVHDPRFFEMGALISAASDPKDIAEQAHALLSKAGQSRQFKGGQMQRLRRARIQINGTVAAQSGYRLDAVPRALVAQ